MDAAQTPYSEPAKRRADQYWCRRGTILIKELPIVLTPKACSNNYGLTYHFSDPKADPGHHPEGALAGKKRGRSMGDGSNLSRELL